MATNHHNAVPLGALASILLALAIGSAPIAALIAFSSALQVQQ